MNRDAHFETRVSGKWVLTGEHAVLRGAMAVALPHPELGLQLFFEPGDSESADGLTVTPASAQKVIDEILTSIGEDQRAQGQAFTIPNGKLEIRSTIPIGAGLGSSAALCVALGRWLSESLGMKSSGLQEFATRLEHRFHGRSSGMDVAVIAAGEPISFSIPQAGSGRGGTATLGVRHLPRFTFHDTGLRTRTNECVLQVEKLKEQDPGLAQQVDEKMGAASRLALAGLVHFDADHSVEALDQIARAMRQAQECFQAWNLVPPEAQKILDGLYAQGALGAKITGAGGGGMIVALWS